MVSSVYSQIPVLIGISNINMKKARDGSERMKVSEKCYDLRTVMNIIELFNHDRNDYQ